MKKVLFILLVLFLVSCSGTNKKEKVVIYSPHLDAILQSVAERFEEATGIYVEFIRVNTDACVDRIRSEKESPKADIMYGGSASYYEILKKEGLLEKSNPTWKNNIDKDFIDKEGYWYAPMQTPAVIFYNTNNIKGNMIPKDWFDITNSIYKDKLQWLRVGGTANTYIACMVYLIEKSDSLDGAWKFLKAFDNNVSQYYAEGGLMYNDINSPMGCISMFVLPNIANGIYQSGYPWAVAKTKSGVINIIDAISLIKGSPNPDNAKKFIEFAGSRENMIKLANDFNRMPTDLEALKEGPQWMQEFDMPSMPIDWAVISEKMGEWVKYFDENIRSK